MGSHLFNYFIDPVLRAPTIGSMLMCFVAALVGVLVVLRKQSLVGEALSHASYPGVILAVIVMGVIGVSEEGYTFNTLLLLCGAFLSAFLGLWVIHLLEYKQRVHSDAALCFVLSAFIGVGVTLASEVQFSFTALYKQTQIYFFGQAATMTDIHIYIYGVFSLIIVAVLFLFYKELHVLIFDRTYAKSLGVNIYAVETIIYTAIVLAVVIGIRSVGVALMSAMLIAPAVAARQFTHRLNILFMLAGLFGLLSGLFGNIFSVEVSQLLKEVYPEARLSLPTGPMIVIVSSMICFVSLLIAPERGVIPRKMRAIYFRFQCVCENILKAMWTLGDKAEIPFQELSKTHFVSSLYIRGVLAYLTYQGWICKPRPGYFSLTEQGRHWASNVVRLHRLWEVYLVQYVGLNVDKVHRSAEEMEHILTPEIEEELTKLLKNPKRDPHNMPIPPKEGG